MAATVGAINPLRYRGYVYDAETGLYYLQSRYDNPETGRFINADGYATTGQGFLNMFAYCNHNPINMIDSAGCLPEWIKGLVKWYVSAIIVPKVEYIEETWAEFHVEITDTTNYQKTKFNLFDKIEEYHNLLMGW